MKAMFRMAKASRQNSSIEFNNFQRLRLVSSLGVVVSLGAGYVWKNPVRIQNDLKEIRARYFG